MKKLLYIKILCLLFVLSSCSNDNDESLIDFAVSVEKESISILEDDSEVNINLIFSRPASETGSIIVEYDTTNAEYGVDFTTTPSANSGKISIPVSNGDLMASFKLNKLTNPIEGTNRTIKFSINTLENQNWVLGATIASTVNFTQVASSGDVVNLLTGGPNQPNQCYIDLSTGKQTTVKRDTWEIAVYNGNQNRVYLNASLLVAAAELKGITDINSVNENTVLSETLTLNSYGEPSEVSTISELLVNLPVSYSQFSNVNENIVFTDSKEGDLDGTAFSEISTTDSENNVYVISLGNEIPTETPDPGSIETTGDHRGFMKVRILTNGSSYTIQYADLDDTSFQEIVVNKNSDKTISAVSLTSESEVDLEPNKDKWDINFSGVFSFNSRGYGVTYSDYGLHNTLGGTGIYQVTTYQVEDDVRTDFDVPSYTEFSAEDIDETEFITDNRAIIGSAWRSFTLGIAKDDRYYILKDIDNNYYKIRFTALLSDSGERGYSQFEYKKL